VDYFDAVQGIILTYGVLTLPKPDRHNFMKFPLCRAEPSHNKKGPTTLGQSVDEIDFLAARGGSRLGDDDVPE
jgi:hypothetical protein